MADQGVSSATNFTLSAVLLWTLDLKDFGAFTVAYLAYGFGVSLLRSLVSEPFVIGFTAGAPPRVRHEERKAVTAALLFGAGGFLLLLAASPLLSDRLWPSLVALAISLPGLFLQDTVRFVFFARGEPRKSFINDTFWGIGLAVSVASILLFDIRTVWVFLGAWGATGSAAGVLGLVQARIVPERLGGKQWFTENRHLGARLAGASVLNKGSSQISMYAIGGLVGLETLGAISGARVLLGPVNVLFAGISTFALPEAVRSARLPRLDAIVRRLARGLPSIPLLGGLVLLGIASVNDDWLPGNWTTVRKYVPFVMAFVAAAGSIAATSIGLKALSAGTRILRIQGYAAPILILGSALGALIGGGLGAALGLAVGNMIGAALWWLGYQRQIAQSQEHKP